MFSHGVYARQGDDEDDGDEDDAADDDDGVGSYVFSVSCELFAIADCTLLSRMNLQHLLARRQSCMSQMHRP